MNYSFEYIDIILLAMIAGFIFLRLRGILGKKTGHEENIGATFTHDFPKKNEFKKINEDNFDEKAKANFLKGAKIAYESIIISFASGNIKEIKNLLNKEIINNFGEAIKERKSKGLISETTFIGINSADIEIKQDGLAVNGNLVRASELLGIHRNTLSRKVKSYRLRKKSWPHFDQ